MLVKFDLFTTKPERVALMHEKQNMDKRKEEN